LHGIVDVAGTRLEATARTAILGSYRSAAIANYAENQDVLKPEWEWLCAKSARTCAACLALDGTKHKISDGFQKSHVNCRCTSIPVLKDGPAIARETGEEWLAKQDAAVQDRILGKQGGAQYRAGNVALDDFVTLDRDARWGDSYRKATLGEAMPKAGLRRIGPSPARPKPQPTAPVSDAFMLPPEPAGLMLSALKIRGDVDVRAVALDGTKAIDSVHKDGVLPRIPVRTDFDQFSKVAARFEFNVATQEPIAIGVNSLKQWNLTARESFVHEVGHFLDFSGIGTPGSFASYGDPLFEGWRKATRASKAIQQLEAEQAAGVRKIPWPDGTTKDYPIDQKYVGYLLDSSEVWARSYSQYITRKSGDTGLARAFEETKQTSMYATTWEEADFAPIEQAIDDLFRSLGWLP
jgi:hypothetical protein